MPDNDLDKYFKINDFKKFKLDNNNETSLITIKNEKDSKFIMIYDNFELIEIETIKLFIDNIKGNESNYLECTLNDGKIIIHYPDNFNGKNQFVSVIGSINKENLFITEYILIYNNSKEEKKEHLNKIIGRLDKYLNNLQLYNKYQPIYKDDKSLIEIGIIIKYESNIIDNNVKKNSINNNKINDNNIQSKNINNIDT